MPDCSAFTTEYGASTHKKVVSSIRVSPVDFLKNLLTPGLFIRRSTFIQLHKPMTPFFVEESKNDDFSCFLGPFRLFYLRTSVTHECMICASELNSPYPVVLIPVGNYTRNLSGMRVSSNGGSRGVPILTQVFLSPLCGVHI